MELWGGGKLWQHRHGLQKGGGGNCGRRNEAPLVAEHGWRYQKAAGRQRWRLPGHVGVEAVAGFVVCVHVEVGSGLWCVCMCMLWSHLHGWKTLLSCCVNETCLLLTSPTKVLRLLPALPLVHHQCKTVLLLAWSVFYCLSCPWRAVILYPAWVFIKFQSSASKP